MLNLQRWRPLVVAAVVALGACVVVGAGSARTRIVAGASAQQTVTVAVAGDTTDFDPYTDTLLQYRYIIFNTVFDPLVRYTPRLGFQPALATKWSVNKAGTVWTFNLRHSVKFHDGEDFNAAAAITSLKAIPSASIFEAPLANVASYSAPAPDKLVIKLKKPYAPFLDGLAEIAIVAPNALDTVGKDPIGTGAFRFTSWTPNNQIVLTKNDAYWGPKPSYQQLVFKPVADPTVALTDLQAGQVDIVANVPYSATRAGLGSAQVVAPPTSNKFEMVEFNSSAPDVKNPLVRRALAYALDKSSIGAISFGSAHAAISSPFAPSSFAYSAQRGYPYNLRKAQALLKQAHESNLHVTVMVPNTNPDVQLLARVWQASLAKINVTLNIDVLPLTTWAANYSSHNYQMTTNTYSSSADPSAFFSIFFGVHKTDFHNAQFYKLIDKGVATPDPKKRKVVYAKLQHLLDTQLPVLIGVRMPLLALAAPNVHGYALNPLGWSLFTNVTVG